MWYYLHITIWASTYRIRFHSMGEHHIIRDLSFFGYPTYLHVYCFIIDVIFFCSACCRHKLPYTGSRSLQKIYYYITSLPIHSNQMDKKKKTELWFESDAKWQGKACMIYSQMVISLAFFYQIRIYIWIPQDDNYRQDTLDAIDFGSCEYHELQLNVNCRLKILGWTFGRWCWLRDNANSSCNSLL